MGRFNQWIQRRKKFPPEGHVVSGRLAEFRLFKLARAVSGKAMVLEGIRIPDPVEGGRREIDMVIATKDLILFVEQKHWSGTFIIKEDGKFLQTRKDGSHLEHKNIIEWTSRKGELLQQIHEKRSDEPFPKSKTILVFSNSNLDWSPLPKNSGAEAYNEIDFINMIEKLDLSEPGAELKETLCGFGTWDTIHLNGGKTIHGDILEYPFEKRNCRITHTGLLGLITGVKSNISTGEVVNDLSGPLVSVVGEDGSRVIPFAHISRIEFSNPKKDWG